jgi:hypothetical protein
MQVNQNRGEPAAVVGYALNDEIVRWERRD